jgi:hypothetical protein
MKMLGCNGIALTVCFTGLLLCALSGVTLAQTLSAPLTLSAAAGGVYIYNPASRTIVSPVYYTNELIVVPWQDFNPSMLWNVTDVGAVSYISAVSASAAGCSLGQTAFWNGVPGSVVETVCATSELSVPSFTFGVGSKAGNYVIYQNVPGGNSSGECVTIAAGVPTLPAAECTPLTPTTQWQLVAIGETLPATTTTPPSSASTTTQPTTGVPTTTSLPASGSSTATSTTTSS